MDNVQNQVQEPIENLDAEAVKAEEEALKGADESQIRAQVIEKYGLSEDSNPELINSLVADKLEDQKKLGTAIKQKINWRTKATKPVEPEPEPAKPVVVAPVDPTSVAKLVDERFEQRELASLELSDEIKAEINKYAKLNNVPIREATKSEYITFIKEKAQKAVKIENATLAPSHGTQSTKDFSNMSPNDFDRSTPEGRKDWDAWKAWNKTQG